MCLNSIQSQWKDWAELMNGLNESTPQPHRDERKRRNWRKRTERVCGEIGDQSTVTQTHSHVLCSHVRPQCSSTCIKNNYSFTWSLAQVENQAVPFSAPYSPGAVFEGFPFLVVIFPTALPACYSTCWMKAFIPAPTFFLRLHSKWVS